MNTIVGEVSVLQELSMSTWSVWHVPSMHFLAVVVDKLDCARACKMGEECITWRNFVRVDTAKPNASSNECALLHFGCENQIAWART